MPNYLITGAAGFIGSHFCEYMVNNYPDSIFVGYDKLTYAGKMENLDSVISHHNFHFIKGDITDYGQVFETLTKYNIDIIVNFAAESHVDRSIEDSRAFIHTNVLGTQIMLDAAKRNNVKRFHQVSTDEVYGDLPLNRKDLKFTENSHLKPSSPYSASKASADLLVMSYYKTHNLPVSISRCSNNYGLNQDNEKLIPKVISNAINNKKIPIYSKGENIRDWIHVSDHVTAIEKILLSQKSIGEVFNIGGENEVSNIELVNLILEKMSRESDLIEYVEDRKGHDLRYAIDNSKIFHMLKWQPVVNFNKGIDELIAKIKLKPN